MMFPVFFSTGSDFRISYEIILMYFKFYHKNGKK